MSVDESVTKDLIETLENGKEGFAKGAEKLEGTTSPESATLFRQLSEQRSRFSAELRELAKDYGDNIHQSGSVAGALHRGWMSLKDALTGSDPDGVIKAACTGEDHAVEEYKKAAEADLSPTLRSVVQRQMTEVVAARDRVRALVKAA